MVDFNRFFVQPGELVFKKKDIGDSDYLNKNNFILMSIKKTYENIVNRISCLGNDNLIFNSIYGFAIGDALGVPFEFKSREQMKINPVNKMVGYGSHNVSLGTWSDDTSMVIATLDSLIQKGKIDYNDIMYKYCEWVTQNKYTATGKTFDIGKTTRDSINKYVNGVSSLECGSSDFYSNGNGSLMRMLPVIVYIYLNKISNSEMIQIINNYSKLTHNHEISKLGCRIYCDYMLALFDGKSKYDALYDITKKNYSDDYSLESIAKYKRILSGGLKNFPEFQINSTGYIVDTLEACLWCILNSNSYEEAVLKSINLGDDTDTIGAITGSIAGTLYGINNIPLMWIIQLKSEKKLYSYCKKFDSQMSNTCDKKNVGR